MQATDPAVLVIGSGVSGLVASYELAKRGIATTLVEADKRVGGHCHGVEVDGVTVDIGFQVCNPVTYPNLWRVWAELGVTLQETSMSLSIETPASTWCSEWASPTHTVKHSADWLRCWLSEPLRTAGDCALFTALLPLLVVFFRHAHAFLARAAADPAAVADVTLGAFLAAEAPSLVASHYVQPMCQAIWSVDEAQLGGFNALFVLRFLNNHQLLQLSPPQWFTIAGGSSAYVEAIIDPSARWAPFLELKRSTRVVSLAHAQSGRWLAVTSDGAANEYDDVIVATHPDAWTSWDWPRSFAAARWAARFPYTTTQLYVHRDAALMPRRTAAWASWNVLDGRGLSYWIQRLQPRAPANVFVSLRCEPGVRPDPALTEFEAPMQHPCFDTSWAGSLAGLAQTKPARLHFAGAWMYNGFHEDGARAALVAVQAVLDAIGHNKHQSALAPVARRFGTVAPCAAGSLPVIDVPRALSSTAQRLVGLVGRMLGTPRYGTLIVYSSATLPLVLASPTEPTALVVTMQIHDVWPFVRETARAGELGLARAYRDGLWSSADLVALMRWFICNEPDGSGLLARVQNRVNALGMYRWLRNTLGQAQRNIEAHYDLGNTLYSRMLDPTMAYSCGIFVDPTAALAESMESASVRKFDALLERLEVGPTDRVLEIGGGWGGLAARGKATGKGGSWTLLSLSTEQKAHVDAMAIDGVDYRLEDYRLHAPADGRLYDGVVSCEMIEAVGAEFLDGYFQTLARLVKPGGRVVLQAITRAHAAYAINAHEADSLNTLIFPGGCLPSMQAIQVLAETHGLVLEDARDIGMHYVGTLTHWRRSFDAVPDAEWESLGFDAPFRRLWRYYLDICAAAFGEAKIQDYQLAYRRRVV